MPTIEARTRDFLARLIGTCVAIAVGFAGAYALMTGQHAAIEVVWAIAGPLVGVLMTHYFSAYRRETG